MDELCNRAPRCHLPLIPQQATCLLWIKKSRGLSGCSGALLDPEGKPMEHNRELDGRTGTATALVENEKMPRFMGEKAESMATWGDPQGIRIHLTNQSHLTRVVMRFGSATASWGLTVAAVFAQEAAAGALTAHPAPGSHARTCRNRSGLEFCSLRGALGPVHLPPASLTPQSQKSH